MFLTPKATIVIAYLMSRYKLPLSLAYRYVKMRRPIVQPNPHFSKILEYYEYELNSSSYLRRVLGIPCFIKLTMNLLSFNVFKKINQTVIHQPFYIKFLYKYLKKWRGMAYDLMDY